MLDLQHSCWIPAFAGMTVSGSPVWFQYSAPLIGIVFLLVCLRVWGFGVRRYMSTGS